MNRPDHPGRNRGTDPVAPGARLSQTRYTLGGALTWFCLEARCMGTRRIVSEAGRLQVRIDKGLQSDPVPHCRRPRQVDGRRPMEGPGCGAATCEGSRNEFHYAEREPMHRLESEHESRFGQLC